MKKAHPRYGMSRVVICAFTFAVSEVRSAINTTDVKGPVMSEDIELKYSPLCQDIERDGNEVEVLIYDDGTGRWLLEVVDENNGSTVWDDPFDTDQEAFDEVMNCINTEGIQSLIGSPNSIH
jgi:hypothetical protein